jgi:hypothetical protein
MLKRLLAVVLAVSMTFGLAVSALASGDAAISGDTEGQGDLNLNRFSTLLDITGQTPGGGTAQFFRSYAFVPEGKDSLRWKEIKSRSLTVELLWDISGLVRRPGKLILSSADVKDNTAKTADACENADASDSITYAVYTINAIAPNPAKIGRDKITYGNSDAFIDIGEGREWSRDKIRWRPADGNGVNGTDDAEKWCSLPLSSVRQTIFVRNAGDPDGITMSSVKSVKVTVPAIPKAPRVNIYIGKGFLSARAGMEISNDGEVWAKMDENTVPLGAVTELPASSGSGSVQIDLNDGNDAYVRNPAGNRPPSDSFAVGIKLRDSGEVSEEHFIPSHGKTIRTDKSVTVEAFMDGKWKKVKKFNADKIPHDGLRVRRAGTKDRMPGAESVLRLENRSITVSET